MLIPCSSRRNLTRFSAHSKPLFRRNGAFLPLTMFLSVNNLERKNEYHERVHRRFEARLVVTSWEAGPTSTICVRSIFKLLYRHSGTKRGHASYLVETYDSHSTMVATKPLWQPRIPHRILGVIQRQTCVKVKKLTLAHLMK